MRLLIIEGDPQVRQLVRAAFAVPSEIAVMEAPSGAMGLTCAQRERPDVIALDVDLPDMAVEDVLRGIRQSEASGAAVVLLASRRDGSELDALRGLGADDVIVKPFDPLELSRRVLEIWDTRRSCTSTGGAVPEPQALFAPTQVLVALTDPERCTRVAEALAEHGIRALVAGSVDAALRALGGTSLPDGLVTEQVLPDGEGLAVVRRLHVLPGGRAATVLVLGDAGTLAARATALRWGASRHLPLDAPPEDVAEAMWSDIQQRLQRPGRVLCVEDDPDQVMFLRTLLESSGHEVRACVDARGLEAALEAFRPDLIIMDIDLDGELSGVDLTRALRQDDRYATLPILYHTAHVDDLSRIDAIDAGGDDLIPKSSAPDVVVQQVASRLERSRKLRGLVEQDAMTQLLTHVAFVEACERVMEQQRGRREPCALVLMDIDHFKRVNDTHGHVAGDGVITALAALLRDRFRHSDCVGRYGGEEFAVVLPAASESKALELANRVRVDFEALEHRTPDGVSFRCTLSAGVAMLTPDFADAMSWIREADSALYVAKAAARNCVRSASTKVRAGQLDF